ncbi:MAG: NAD(P)/FAD-dependent oxidoreductase, partial [Bacteroidota bacterium]
MPKLIELALAPEKAADPAAWHAEAIRLSGIPGNEIKSVNLRKRSIDARSKHVLVRMQVEIRTISDGSDNKSEILSLQQVQDAPSVVIAGCGPAGMFAALRLIECGIKPIIVERGKPVRERRRDLAQLNRERVVNPDSNYCFGEGGAGTYSDGKLYTRSGKRGDINRILETFIQFGASPDIAIDAHPHIGTNKLPAIIAEMNKTIVACGGEILFNTRVTGMVHDSTGVRKVTVQSTTGNQEPYDISCSGLILATGHSSRDVFEMLHQNRIAIEAKPFALGVRIEHPQHEIDRIRYHCDSRGAYLPPASYALVEQAVGRGVYSFCMCPG